MRLQRIGLDDANVFWSRAKSVGVSNETRNLDFYG